MLEADELLIVIGKDVCELFPPALLRRIFGEREEEIAVGPSDLVVVEQSLDFPRPQAGLGPLVPADLGGRPSQRRGDGFSALPPALPDPAQFSGKAAPPHRGASWPDHRATSSSGPCGPAG